MRCPSSKHLLTLAVALVAARIVVGCEEDSFNVPSLDLNLDYQLKKWLQIYVAAQNVLNARTVTMRYGSETPDYAKAYLTGANGMGITMGIKGTF